MEFYNFIFLLQHLYQLSTSVHLCRTTRWIINRGRERPDNERHERSVALHLRLWGGFKSFLWLFTVFHPCCWSVPTSIHLLCARFFSSMGDWRMLGQDSPAGPGLMQQAAVLTDVHGREPTSASAGPQEPLKGREDGGTDLALVTGQQRSLRLKNSFGWWRICAVINERFNCLWTFDQVC